MNSRGVSIGLACMLLFTTIGWLLTTIDSASVEAQDEPQVQAANKDQSSNPAPRKPRTRKPRTSDPFGTGNPSEASADFGPFGTADPDGSQDEILAALEEKGEWDFVETPLKEMVAYIRSAGGIDVVINVRALNDLGLSSDTPVTCHLKDITLGSFLEIVLSELDLTHELHDGALWITTEEEAESRMSVRTYPVSDLIRISGEQSENAYDYDSLIELITGYLEPDSWSEVGGPGAIDAIYGALVVTNVRTVHEQLAAFLAAYRQVVREHNENPLEPGIPVFIGDSTSRNKFIAALEKPISVDLQDTPLVKGVEFLAKTTGIPIVIDVRALEEIGLDGSALVTVRVKQLPMRFVLRRMLDQLDLAWMIQNEVLAISSEEEIEHNLQACIYPVYDLVAMRPDAPPEEYDFDTLIQVLSNTIEPDQWDDVGGPATIGVIADPASLVISQTEAVHEELHALFKELRRAKRLERKSQKEQTPGLSHLKLQTYSLKPGIEREEILPLLTKLLGEDFFVGHGVVIQVLGNDLIVRHEGWAHQKIQKVLFTLWPPPPVVGGGGGGFGGGGFGGGAGGGGFGGGGQF